MVSSTLAVFALLATLTAASTPEFKEMFMGAVHDCQADHHIDEEGIKKMLLEGAHTDDEKCMLACMLKKFGIIHENKVDVDKCLELNKIKYTEPENIHKADEVVKACSTTVPATLPNECDLAYEVMHCFRTEAQKHNLPMPKVF